MSQPNPTQDWAERVIRRDQRQTWLPFGKPQHFARKRSDMTVSTEWFNNIQSGFYSTLLEDPISQTPTGEKRPFCLGLLVSKHFQAGAYMDQEIVITTINSPDGTQRITDMRAAHMSRNVEERAAVGFIIQQGAADCSVHGFPFSPCTGLPENLDSCVVGWYVPVEMWAMRNSANKLIWWCKLEKVGLDQNTWIANPDNGTPPSLDERDYVTKAEVELCTTCDFESTRMYQEGFVCLNQHCADWCRVNGEVIEAGVGWTYTDKFLKERTDPRQAEVKGLVTTFPNLYESFDSIAMRYTNAMNTYTQQPTKKNAAAVCKMMTEGFACPDCGMLNERNQWHQFKCHNEDCTFTYSAPPPVLTSEVVKQLNGKERAVGKLKKFEFQELLGYQGPALQVGDWTKHTAKFGKGAYITVLKPGGASMGIADLLLPALLQLMNSGELGVERRLHVTPSTTLLTNHFAVNFGEEYVYRTHVPTLPLSQTPDPVKRSLEWINMLLPQVLPTSNNQFNQCYIAAYSQSQKMNMHDDGEKGLGSVVASLTLGGQGQFVVGIPSKIDYGRTFTAPNNWITEDPIIRGCLEYDYRREIKDQLTAGEIDQATWSRLFKDKMEQHKPTKRGQPKSIMRLPLEHGDILLMHGKNFQKYLKHSAEVSKDMPLRIALTFRKIKESHQGQKRQSNGEGEPAAKKVRAED